MFTWICPKCGTEVPPSHSECPKCSDAAAEQQEPAAPPPPAAPAARPSSGMHVPGWVVSILFGVLFVAVLAGGFWIYSSRHKAGDAAPAIQAASPFEAPRPAVAPPDPILTNLEITGLRLTEDSSHRAFVQFVVVNHSAADLGEVSAKVDLKAGTGARSVEPVGTFAFKTTLGPYESKDIKAPLSTKLRVYELPDWQFLRPELSK
jgi:hypothetical protein